MSEGAADSELLIRIRTEAELDGLNQTQAALKKQIVQMSQAGKPVGELVAKYKEGSKQARELSEKLEEQGKHAEFLGVKHGVLHKAVHRLSEAFPLLGAAASAAMSPISFLILTSITLFSKMKEHIDEVNKSLDEQAEKLREGQFLPEIVAREQAIKKAKQAYEEYRHELAMVTTVEREFKAAVDATTAALDAKAGAKSRVEDARTAAERANVDRMQAGGKLTPEQAEVYRSAIDDRERSRKTAEAEASEQRKIDAALDEQGRRGKASPQLASAVEAAAKRNEEAQGALAVHQKKVEAAGGEDTIKKGYTKSVKDAADAAAGAYENLGGDTGYESAKANIADAPFAFKAIAELKEAAERAANALKQNEKDIGQIKGDKAEQNVAAAAQNLKDLQAEQLRNTQALTTLSEQLKQLNEHLAATKQGNAGVNAIDQAASDAALRDKLGPSKAVTPVATAGTLSNQIAGYGQQLKYYEDMIPKLEKANRMDLLKQVLDYIRRLHDRQDAAAAQLRQMQSRLNYGSKLITPP